MENTYKEKTWHPANDNINLQKTHTIDLSEFALHHNTTNNLTSTKEKYKKKRKSIKKSD